MELVTSNFIPGDPRLIDQIVYELKSQGIFDQFRKECIADVDTKPAYQNLRQRVEGSVTNFLSKQKFKGDLNKNQLREQLRKSISESGILETGVERIVDQVVNPKITTVFRPKVEDVVYQFLGLKKPNRHFKKEIKVVVENLLPNDLEAVSPESVNDQSLNSSTEKKEECIAANDNSLNSSHTKTEEDESPPFEPIEETTNFSPPEENSVDSHFSGISGLVSHHSSNSTDMKISTPMDISQDISQNSQNSCESNLSKGNVDKITANENMNGLESHKESKDKCAMKDEGEEETSKKEKGKNSFDDRHVEKADELEKSLKHEERKDEEKIASESKKNHDSRKIRDKHKSKKEDKDRNMGKSKDHKEHKSSSSRHRSSSSKDNRTDKKVSRNEKDNKGASEKDKKERDRDRSKEKTGKSKDNVEKDKDKNKISSSSSSKHTKEKLSSSTKKDSSNKDRDKVVSTKDNRKESTSSTNKAKDCSKNKDIKSSKSGSSSSNGYKDKEKNKDNKRPKPSGCSEKSHKRSGDAIADKEKSSARHDKDKKSGSKKDKDKKPTVDDHYGVKNKKGERRSTDRDSNDGSSSKTSRNGSLAESYSCRTSGGGGSSKESSEVFSSGGSGDSSNSDRATEFCETVPQTTIKYIKPKFASNIHEAMKIMKIRRQLAKMERENQLALAQVEMIKVDVESKGRDEEQPAVIKEERADGVLKQSKDVKMTKGHDGENENIQTDEGPEGSSSLLLQSKDLSMEHFEALEARLAQEMSNVNCNVYGEEDDTAEYNSTVVSPLKKRKAQGEARSNVKKVFFESGNGDVTANGEREEIELIVDRNGKNTVKRREIGVLEEKSKDAVAEEFRVKSKNILGVEGCKEATGDGNTSQSEDKNTELNEVNFVNKEIVKSNEFMGKIVKQDISAEMVDDEGNLRHIAEDTNAKNEPGIGGSVLKKDIDEIDDKDKREILEDAKKAIKKESKDKCELNEIEVNNDSLSKGIVKDAFLDQIDESLEVNDSQEIGETDTVDFAHKKITTENSLEGVVSNIKRMVKDEFLEENDCMIKQVANSEEIGTKNEKPKIVRPANPKIAKNKKNTEGINPTVPIENTKDLDGNSSEKENRNSEVNEEIRDMFSKNRKRLFVKIDKLELLADLKKENGLRNDVDRHGKINEIEEEEEELEELRGFRRDELYSVDAKVEEEACKNRANNKNGYTETRDKWEDEESPCYYFEKPCAKCEKRIEFLRDVVGRLEKAIEEQSLKIQNNIPKIKMVGKKRKAEDPKSQSHKPGSKRTHTSNMKTNLNTNKESLFNTDVSPPNHSFSLPLSPAESDQSGEHKKEEPSPISVVKAKRGTYSRASIGNIKNKRYSSEDLYKPRPVFSVTSSRRRGAKIDDKS